MRAACRDGQEWQKWGPFDGAGEEGTGDIEEQRVRWQESRRSLGEERYLSFETAEKGREGKREREGRAGDL